MKRLVLLCGEEGSGIEELDEGVIEQCLHDYNVRVKELSLDFNDEEEE